MNGITIYPMEDTPALRAAAQVLSERGVELAPSCDTATHLLFPVPSTALKPESLPPSAAIIGGNLGSIPETYEKIDLLQNPQYVAANAALTADCALRLLGKHLPVSFLGCPVLVIGWGRIGKCLAAMLKAIGAEVTVAARQEADRAMLLALGYGAVAPDKIRPHRYRAILNTAPAPILPRNEADCVKIDLASRQGMAGEDVIWARGLPGKILPESAGKLIAESILRILREKGERK